MNLRTVLSPLIALAVLALIGAQTSNALRESGTWASPPRHVKFAVDPYASLDRAIAQAASPVDSGPLRDPFQFGRSSQPIRVLVRRLVTPTPPPLPVVTAIVTGAGQGRAIVMYAGANYSVKEGDLFAHYKVISITAEHVVVDDGTGRVVLKRPSKGD